MVLTGVTRFTDTGTVLTAAAASASMPSDETVEVVMVNETVFAPASICVGSTVTVTVVPFAGRKPLGGVTVTQVLSLVTVKWFALLWLAMKIVWTSARFEIACVTS